MIDAMMFGLHSEVGAVQYHADDFAPGPSLSSSIAKTIVDETPFKAWMGHPRLNPNFKIEYDDKFSLGDAVHDMLSSGGKRVGIVAGSDDWRKPAARTARDNLRREGLTPLLEHQFDEAAQITGGVRFMLEDRKIDLGIQEGVFLAEDHGVLLRAMMDSWNPPFIRDFKISKINLANDFTVGSHIASLHYDLRAWFYIHVAELVFPEWAGRLKFEWIFVEAEPPYGIRIVEADATMLEMGRRKAFHAIGVWQRCLETNVWPHLQDLSPTVPYPSFRENSWLEREMRDDFVQGPK